MDLDVRRDYQAQMDSDPVKLSQWVVGWFQRFEWSGKSSGEAAQAISQVAMERQIPVHVLGMAMFLVALNTEAEECFAR